MAIFPGAIATDANLYIAVDNLSTLLTDNPLTSGATTVNVADTTLFPTVGFISIDAEIIFYTGKTATSFTGCTRGALGTIAASHVLNSQVDHNIVSAHHNAPKDEIIAIETHLGINGANIVHIAGSETITGQKSFSDEVLFSDGTAALPALSFISDPDTGLYRSSANQLDFATNGVQRFAIGSAGLISSLGKHEFTDGTAVLPSVAFSSDPDTGLYLSATNQIGFAAGGVLQWTISSTGHLTGTTGTVNTGSGTAAAPAYTFFGDENTGMYRVAADSLGFAVGGVQTFRTGTTNTRFSTNVVPDVDATNALGASALGWTRLFVNAGSAASPSLTFSGDIDTGIYNPTGNSIFMVTAGIARLGVDSSGNTYSEGVIQTNSNGTAGAPAYSFAVDTDTGFYRIGANQWGLSAGSTVHLFVDSAGDLNILGTDTNSTASAGYVGEYIESVVGNTNFPTSTQWGDLTSISLTAGDWDVTAQGTASASGATVTDWSAGISTTAGNSAAGLVVGSNRHVMRIPNAAEGSFTAIPNYRISLAATTTIYFKYISTFAGGPPVLAGRLSARRIR